MASTNKTTNYELSQFLGTDKPAWLSDYNSDMSKIDTQMKANADAATAAGGTASSATTAIGDLTNLTTTAKTSLVAAVNEVDSNADTAQNTANSASTSAEAANTKVNQLASYFTLTQFTTPTVTPIGVNVTANDISCASNATGTLGKIYGRINLVSNVNGSFSFSFPTPLRPTQNITINGGGLTFWNASGETFVPAPLSYEIAVNGTVSVTINGAVANRGYRIFFNNSLIFATNFGDVPTPE